MKTSPCWCRWYYFCLSRRRPGLNSRTLSVFVFLCFSRLYTDSTVGHPRLDRQNDTLPEWLRGSPAKWVVFDRRGSNPLGVVSGYWRNRKRASLARTRYWDRNPDTPNLCSHGLVGYDARLTRERSRVQFSVRISFSYCKKCQLGFSRATARNQRKSNRYG